MFMNTNNKEKPQEKKYILERYQWFLIYVLPILVILLCSWLTQIIGQIILFICYALFLICFRLEKLKDSKFIQYFTLDDRKVFAEAFFTFLIGFNLLFIVIYGIDWLSHTRFLNEEKYEIVYTIPTIEYTQTERRRSAGKSFSTYHVIVAYMDYYVNGQSHDIVLDLPNGSFNYIYVLKVNKNFPEYVDLIKVPRSEIKVETAILMNYPDDIQKEFIYYPKKESTEFSLLYRYNEYGNYDYINNNCSILTQNIDHVIKVPLNGFKENPYTLLTGEEYVEMIYKHNRYKRELNEKLHNIVYTIPWFFNSKVESRINIFAKTPEEAEFTVDVGTFYYTLDGENYYSAFIELPQDYSKYIYALKVNKDYPKAADVVPIPLDKIPSSLAFDMENFLLEPAIERVLFKVSNEESSYFIPRYKYNSYGNIIYIDNTFTRESLTKNVEKLIELPLEGFSQNPFRLLTGKEYKESYNPSKNPLLIFSTFFATLAIVVLNVLRAINSEYKYRKKAKENELKDIYEHVENNKRVSNDYLFTYILAKHANDESDLFIQPTKDEFEEFSNYFADNVPDKIINFISVCSGEKTVKGLVAGYTLYTMPEILAMNKMALNSSYNLQESTDNKIKTGVFKKYWLPFAGNGNNLFFCFDCDAVNKTRVGQIILVDLDANSAKVIAKNLKEFLLWLKLKHEEGNIVYHEEGRARYFTFENGSIF